MLSQPGRDRLNLRIASHCDAAPGPVDVGVAETVVDVGARGTVDADGGSGKSHRDLLRRGVADRDEGSVARGRARTPQRVHAEWRAMISLLALADAPNAQGHGKLPLGLPLLTQAQHPRGDIHDHGDLVGRAGRGCFRTCRAAWPARERERQDGRQDAHGSSSPGGKSARAASGLEGCFRKSGAAGGDGTPASGNAVLAGPRTKTSAGTAASRKKPLQGSRSPSFSQSALEFLR